MSQPATLNPSIEGCATAGSASCCTPLMSNAGVIGCALTIGASVVDTSSLIDRYCEIWSEPLESRRRELLASVWGPHATYTDPTVHAASAEELLSHIAKVQARRPGARVVRTSKVDLHHGIARFAWHVVQADGTALPEGLDIAFISSERTRIERIIGFFGLLAREVE